MRTHSTCPGCTYSVPRRIQTCPVCGTLMQRVDLQVKRRPSGCRDPFAPVPFIP